MSNKVQSEQLSTTVNNVKPEGFRFYREKTNTLTDSVIAVIVWQRGRNTQRTQRSTSNTVTVANKYGLLFLNILTTSNFRNGLLHIIKHY